MPQPQQQFQVLRCFKCSTFQVHPVKKSIKWACKMCGEKQSVKCNYGSGTGKDCRTHVQKLNYLRGELGDTHNDVPDHNVENNENSTFNVENEVTEKTKKSIPSKWGQYVECGREPEPILPVIDEQSFQDAEIVLERPKDKPRKRHSKPIDNDQNGTDCIKFKPLTSPINKPSIVETFVPKSTANSTSPNNPSTPSLPLVVAAPSYSNFNGADLVREEYGGYYQNKPKAIFEPPKVSENSKWAQYVEHDSSEGSVENNLVETVTNVKETSTEPRGISFSQCSDEDIDGLLEIYFDT